jgi:hypothetical protein
VHEREIMINIKTILKKEKKEMRDYITALLFISAMFFVFLLVIVFVFTIPSFKVFDYTVTGPIGDTIGGITAPIVGVICAGLTFLAFYLQYEANKILSQDSNQTSFENKFYEMLRLHKSNVEELSIELNNGTEIRGREVFVYLRKEFNLIFELLNDKIRDPHFYQLAIKTKIEIVYSIFYYGIEDRESWFHKNDVSKTSIICLENIKSINPTNLRDRKNDYLDDVLSQNKLQTLMGNTRPINIFDGYYLKLNHYYRHLYFMVKIVDKAELNKDVEKDKEAKNDFLRILRAQLSVIEQAMLFYNWYSERGWQWESASKNKYFTKYRIIHNLHPGLLIKGLKLEEIFSDWYKNNDSKSHKLFEFEEWLEKTAPNHRCS